MATAKEFVLSPEDAEAQRRWIDELVSSWPPLTPTEKAKLRVLMFGASDDDQPAA